jgi:hypothetical protein
MPINYLLAYCFCPFPAFQILKLVIPAVTYIRRRDRNGIKEEKNEMELL